MEEQLYNIINYLLSYDLDWWMPKFEYKDTDEGYWKKIKTSDTTNTIYSIPDHKVWVKYY